MSSFFNMHFTSYLVHKCFFSFLYMQLVCQLHVERPVDLWQEFVSILPVVYVNFIRNMTYFIGPFFLFVFCRMLFLSLVFLQSRESKSKNTYIKKKNIKVCISVEKYKTTNIFSLHKMAKLDKLFFPETRVNVLLIKY